jgi:hypothetical protein
MQIEVVGLADIDRRWALVAEDVSRCLRKAPMEIGPGDIWTNCRSGQWLLIIAHDGENIHGTTVWRFTAHRLFECVILTGRDMKSWLPDLIGSVTIIAKAHDCRGLLATGREGLFIPFKKINPKVKRPRSTYYLEF